MINKVILQGYHTLDLAHYFTAGEDEVKCWTIKKGEKAPEAAGKIHSDMQDGKNI
jgi:obg-like ATPase 1